MKLSEWVAVAALLTYAALVVYTVVVSAHPCTCAKGKP